MSALLATVLNYLVDQFNAGRSPVASILTVVLLVAAIAWFLARLTVTLVNKLPPLGAQAIDAAARFNQTRGRNHASATLSAALAEKGTAQEILQGLREIHRISPMDAPNSSLCLCIGPGAGPPPADSEPSAEGVSWLLVRDHVVGGRASCSGY